MAFLVGQNSSALTTVVRVWAAGGSIGWCTAGYAASSSGTGSTAYLKVNDWVSSTAAKVVVYNSSRALLATATFQSTQGTGTLSAAFDSSFSVTSGQTYYVALAPDAYIDIFCSSASGYTTSDSASGYTSTPTTLPTGNQATPGDFFAYVDGALASAAGRNLLLGVG